MSGPGGGHIINKSNWLKDEMLDVRLCHIPLNADMLAAPADVAWTL